jgi:predicted NUDIX family NTP pyrophosphohydrolase
MPPKASAGLLLYRDSHGVIEVMIVHMGGPFWKRKDDRAWSIPKGEYEPPEDPLGAARREFREETGLAPPAGEPIDLGVLRQRSGKLIGAWAVEADVDVSTINSNSFQMEWPKGSGRSQEFPEVDRAEWFDVEGARKKLVKSQTPFLETLARRLEEGRNPGPLHPSSRTD